MENIEIKDCKDLNCGENVFQTASIAPVENGLEYKLLSDNGELEYIDYLNLSKVVEILGEFFDVNTAVISKENQLISVALGSSVDNAFEKVIENNPLAIAGSTIGFSKEVSESVAKQIRAMQIKNVIAPRFDKSALEYLTKKSNINIIQTLSPLQELLGFDAQDIKVTPFGYLMQTQNHSKLTKSAFKVAGKVKPVQQMAEDAIFAWKISKYTKSKSALVVKDLTLIALVQNKQNYLEAIESVIDIACENSKDAVLATDGALDGEEFVNPAIQGRIGLIIDAGDSVNSKKVVNICDKYNISLIHTGIRNNRF